MYRVPRLHGASLAIIQAWLKLSRFFNTNVEHVRVTNDAGVVLPRGTLVYCVAGDRHVRRAIATASATSEVVGAMAEGTAIGAQGVCRRDGYAWVLFDGALVPVSGTPCYVSAATAGNATNVAPAVPGQFIKQVGIIANTSLYATQGGCFVFLKCCAASDGRQL